MKIMLFRDGQRGVVIKLPGERPLEEIGELLVGTAVLPAGTVPAGGRCGTAGSVRAAPAGPSAGAGGGPSQGAD